MNALPAIITEIQSHNQMSIVKVKLLDDTLFSTVILETPETLSYLNVNNQVTILFKETEVVLSKNLIDHSTLTNALKGIVKMVSKGDLLARIEIELKSERVNSIVTREAFDKLNMEIGDVIFATINSSEIMLTE